jgi:hypothetical protein
MWRLFIDVREKRPVSSFRVKLDVVISSEMFVKSYRLSRSYIQGRSKIMFIFIIRLVTIVTIESYWLVGTSL